MVDDGKRNHHRTGPGRAGVEVNGRPPRQDQEFDRYSWDCVPRNLSKQSEVKAGVSICLFNSAQSTRAFACFYHDRVIGRESCELEREVRLDSGINFRRSFWINIPTAVWKLSLQDVKGGFRV